MMRRENFTPTKYTVLCSKHFREEDIDRTSLSVVRIRNGAVPCIFEAFPKHLKENIHPKRKPPKNRSMSDICDKDDSSSPVSTEVESLKSENKTLKRKLDDSECKLNVTKKKLKVLQQSKRRLTKRNADLKCVLSTLEKKKVYQ